MRCLAALALLAMAGCVEPRPAPLPSRACPPLPLLADRPTTAEYKAWTNQVIALYVQCAKGPK